MVPVSNSQPHQSLQVQQSDDGKVPQHNARIVRMGAAALQIYTPAPPANALPLLDPETLLKNKIVFSLIGGVVLVGGLCVSVLIPPENAETQTSTIALKVVDVALPIIAGVVMGTAWSLFGAIDPDELNDVQRQARKCKTVRILGSSTVLGSICGAASLIFKLPTPACSVIGWAAGFWSSKFLGDAN